MRVETTIQIVISLTPDGKFNFAGPLENKILCYGLLEMAKEAVMKHNPSKILRPAQPDIVPFRG